MNVVNMSLSTTDHVQALEDAANAAYAANVLLVAATGNIGDRNSLTNEVGYPAKYSSVIGVAATDQNNLVASFSSDGAEVEIAAPGVNVLSTTRGGGYEAWNGTSMATPHVAGVAAGVFASVAGHPGDVDNNGSMSASEVRTYLQATADDLGTAGRDVFYGYGLLDAREAVIGQ
jgi:subtilisin family serine protease